MIKSYNKKLKKLIKTDSTLTASALYNVSKMHAFPMS